MKRIVRISPLGDAVLRLKWKGKMDEQYRWTPQDNLIGEAEVKLSALLTQELTSRPAVSLPLLYASVPIRKKVEHIRNTLEEQTGMLLRVLTTEERRDGERHVTVMIEKR